MQISTSQQAELKATHGICANEVCDACHKPLDHVQYTRKDQPGEWCSRVCRDGVEAAERYAATRSSGRQGDAGTVAWHCRTMREQARSIATQPARETHDTPRTEADSHG
jgi:hypothetical protein